MWRGKRAQVAHHVHVPQTGPEKHQISNATIFQAFSTLYDTNNLHFPFTFYSFAGKENSILQSFWLVKMRLVNTLCAHLTQTPTSVSKLKKVIHEIKSYFHCTELHCMFYVANQRYAFQF